MCDRCYYDADVVSQQQSEKAASSSFFIPATNDSSLPSAVTPVVTISSAQSENVAAKAYNADSRISATIRAPLSMPGASGNSSKNQSVLKTGPDVVRESNAAGNDASVDAEEAQTKLEHVSDAEEVSTTKAQGSAIENKPSASSTTTPSRLVPPLWAGGVASLSARRTTSSSAVVSKSASSSIADELTVADASSSVHKAGNSSNDVGRALLGQDKIGSSSSSSSSSSSRVSQLTSHDLDLFMALTTSGASSGSGSGATAASFDTQPAGTLPGASASDSAGDAPAGDDLDVDHETLASKGIPNDSSPGLRRRKRIS